MDASYNNSGGLSNGVISSGDLGPVENRNYNNAVLLSEKNTSKKKKFLLISILILVFAVIIVGIMFVSGVFSETNEERTVRERREFHNYLEERREKILGSISLIEYYYNGIAEIDDFILDEEERIDNNNILDDGLQSFDDIQKRLERGPIIAGVVDEIDLHKNYEALNSIMEKTSEEYKSIVDLTKKMYQISVSEKDVSEILDGYDDKAKNLGNMIRNVVSTRERIFKELSDNNCTDVNSETCDKLSGELLEINSLSRAFGPTILEVYASNGNIDGLELTIEYLNNLIVGTQENDYEKNS